MNRSILARIGLATALGASALAVATTAGPALADGSPVSDDHSRDGAGRQMAELKRALKPYEDVAVAMADGFVPVSECTESPEGGMGVHFMNFARAAQPVDPERPSMLLYGPEPDGSMTLLGAEWFQPDADQNLATDGDRPTLWGRPFDGPMPGHSPEMPVHYDLHVWLFDNNPAGVFAPWNTSVSC